MSDVGPSSPIKGTPPVSGQSSLPKDKSGTQSRQEKQPQGSEKEQIDKPNFDTAVAVSPTVMGLHLHQHVKGEIESIDSEGRPIMATSHAKFALEPDAGLTPGHVIEIKITNLSRTIEGTLATRDDKPVAKAITVTLTLVNLLHQPEVTEEQLNQNKQLQYTYKESQTIDPKVTIDKTFHDDQAALALQKAKTSPAANPKGVHVQTAEENLANPQLTNPTKSRLSPSDMGSLVTQTQNITNQNTTDSSKAAATAGQIPLTPGNRFPVRLVSSIPSKHINQGQPEESLLAGNIIQAIKTLGIGTLLTATIVEDEAAPNPIQLTKTGELVLKGVFIAEEKGTTKTHDSHHLQTGAGTLLLTANGSVDVGTALSLSLISGQSLPKAEDGSNRPMTEAEAKVELVKIESEIQNQRAADSLAISILKSEDGPYKNTQANPNIRTNQDAIIPPLAATPAPNSSSPQTKQDQALETALMNVMAGAKPMSELPIMPLRELAQTWPVMEALQQTLAAAASAASADLTGQLSARTPSANQNFANTALFFMAALGVKDPKAWLGPTLSKTLEGHQKKNIFKTLLQDFSRLSHLKTAPLQGEWRPTLIPFQTEQNIHAMVILNREEQNQQNGSTDQNKDNPEGDDAPNHKRFLIAVDLSNLGKVELDGLLRPLKLDFVLRTEQDLPLTLQTDILNYFETAMEKSELTGSLSFEPLAKSPVDIVTILNEAQAEIADSEVNV